VDQTAKVWQVSNGAVLHTLPAHGEWLPAVAYSADGSTLATATFATENQVRLWR